MLTNNIALDAPITLESLGRNPPFPFNAHVFGAFPTMIHDSSPMETVEPRPSALSHAEISPVLQEGDHGGNSNTKEASTSLYAVNEIGVDNDASAGQSTKKKPINFYLAFFAINITCFLFSLDSTSLSVAIPVSCNR